MVKYLITALCVILGVIGQVLFKQGLIAFGSFNFKQIVSIVFSPYVFTGFVFYGTSSILWLYSLSKFELSKIYPVLSLGYIGTCIAGYYLFGESISLNKIIGISFICIGILILNR